LSERNLTSEIQALNKHGKVKIVAKLRRYSKAGSESGADPAIGGPGGRLPLWAALSEKTGFFRI